MRTQTNRQKIGSAGHSIAQTEIALSNSWIARNLTEDYGIDIELEYTAPKKVNNDTIVTGKFIKAQVRSHRKTPEKSQEKAEIVEYIDYGFLRYAYECRIPIILIVVCIETKECWYVWLQSYILEHQLTEQLYEKATEKELGIKILASSTLKKGLNADLIDIAKFENPYQFYLAIKELAKLSSRFFEDELSQMLNKYLKLLDTDVEKVINTVLDLGTSIWATREGNKVSGMLYDYIRRNGTLFRSTHLRKLIVRDDSYSRTGINALGILYEHYPDHALSLHLPIVFKDQVDPRPYYFCCLRERYINKKAPEWFSGNETNFDVGDLTIPEKVRRDLYLKWANRGDSAILDYVVTKD